MPSEWQMGPISSKLSNAHAPVVPSVAHTKNGIKPSFLSCSIAFFNALPLMHKLSSLGIKRSLVIATSADFSTDECA